jgi:hypothetical protein
LRVVGVKGVEVGIKGVVIKVVEVRGKGVGNFKVSYMSNNARFWHFDLFIYVCIHTCLHI